MTRERGTDLRPDAVNDEASQRSAVRRDRAAIERRRADVARWLADATPSAVISARLVERYHVSQRTAEADLARVRAAWVEQIRREEPDRRVTLLGVLDNVLAGAIADRAWVAAARAASEISKVCGFHAPTKLEIARAEPSMDEVEMLRALRMTNAARLAEIDQLEGEGIRDAEPGIDPEDDLEPKRTEPNHADEDDEDDEDNEDDSP